MRLRETYSCAVYGGKTLRRQRQPPGVAELRISILLCRMIRLLDQNAGLLSNALEVGKRECMPGSALQIARFEIGAFGLAETEAITEIGFEIAVISVDGPERSGKKRLLHRAEHLLDVIGQVAA